ncbi:hypothetical protein [Primorskyibacter marinus]|uniref:hypothetical protein n=1 Tax=Primorskyibacter marinus TaxID=1977320 RepID=UPI0018E577F2|nr:hypothetical protein [Primorskyibacter marinus]
MHLPLKESAATRKGRFLNASAKHQDVAILLGVHWRSSTGRSKQKPHLTLMVGAAFHSFVS